MQWQDYGAISKKQRSVLARRAAQGNKWAQGMLNEYAKAVKKEANQRLRALEKGRVDYGTAYNNLMFYLNTQLGTNRLQTLNKLGKDWYELYAQTEMGLKFLTSPLSIAKNVREQEDFRIQNLIKNEVIPKNFTMRKNKDFLRFLGTEEMSGTIERYGRSDTIVQLAYTVYSRNGATGLRIMQRALLEFLDDRIAFNEAMERAGLKIEDYLTRRGSS